MYVIITIKNNLWDSVFKKYLKKKEKKILYIYIYENVLLININMFFEN